MGDAVETHHGTAIALGGQRGADPRRAGIGQVGPGAALPRAGADRAHRGARRCSSPTTASTSRARASGSMAEAPATIRGKLEVRGLGIVTVPCVASAELVLVADLDGAGADRAPSRSRAGGGAHGCAPAALAYRARSRPRRPSSCCWPWRSVQAVRKQCLTGNSTNPLRGGRTLVNFGRRKTAPLQNSGGNRRSSRQCSHRPRPQIPRHGTETEVGSNP